MSRDTTYSKCLIEILSEDKFLDFDYSVLDKVMDVLKGGVEG